MKRFGFYVCMLVMVILTIRPATAAQAFNCLPSEIRTENGVSVLYAGGAPVTPMSFCSRNNSDPEYVRGLLEAGVKLHFPICDTDWKDPQGFEKLSTLAHRILAIDPQAVLILRLSLDPPRRWMEDNPGECTTFENGSPRMIINTKIGRTWDPVLTDELKFSLASRAWQDKAEEALSDFVLKVAASDFGSRVAGYFFTASETEEWYYTVTYDRRYHAHDFSRPMLEYFREYARRKYGTDEKLAAAWRNDVRSFEQVRIPQLSERTLYTGVGELITRRYDSHSTFGTLANPDCSEFESDYYRALNESVADAIIRFGRKVKELSGGKLLTGAFYGYLTCVVYHEMGITGAASKVQDSGALDFLASPSTYFNRPPGGQATARSPFSSYNLRRMLWFTEEDTRTVLSDYGNWAHWSQAHSTVESCEMLKRDMGKILTRHYHAWWFENSSRDKWYHDPDMLATMKRIQELFAASQRLGYKRAAEIAMVASEPSIFYTDQESLRDMLMWQRQLEFERIGAPYDYYYVRDLADPAMPDYKLYVFLNSVSLSDSERAAVTAKLKKNGATALWLYAPGLIDPDREPKLSVAWMKELTGFDLAYKRGSFHPRFVVDNPRHPLSAGLPRDRFFGQPDRVLYGSFETKSPGWLIELAPALTDPLFYLTDSTQSAGGIYFEEHLTALGETERAGYLSLWTGAKYVQAEVLRAAARRAGVHIYSESGDTFTADGDFVVIHGSTGGAKTLRFPEPVDLYEVFEGKYYGKKVREVTFPLEFGKTKVFCLWGKI